MVIPRRKLPVLFALSAVALAACLCASTALAESALTVKITGGGTSTASARKAKFIAANGLTITCPMSATKQVIPNAVTSGPPPVKIGRITKLTFTNCGTSSLKVTPLRLPYSVEADSKTVNNQTDVIFAGIDFAVSAIGCTYNVTGSAAGYYGNTSHALVTTSKLPVTALNTAQLTIRNVAGCAGLVTNGEHVAFDTTYTLIPATLMIKA
jgi:hypothetical protein